MLPLNFKNLKTKIKKGPSSNLGPTFYFGPFSQFMLFFFMLVITPLFMLVAACFWTNCCFPLCTWYCSPLCCCSFLHTCCYSFLRTCCFSSLRLLLLPFSHLLFFTLRLLLLLYSCLLSFLLLGTSSFAIVPFCVVVPCVAFHQSSLY